MASDPLAEAARAFGASYPDTPSSLNFGSPPYKKCLPTPLSFLPFKHFVNKVDLPCDYIFLFDATPWAIWSDFRRNEKQNIQNLVNHDCPKSEPPDV